MILFFKIEISRLGGIGGSQPVAKLVFEVSSCGERVTELSEGTDLSTPKMAGSGQQAASTKPGEREGGDGGGWGILVCGQAGLFAALASVFAKFAFSPETEEAAVKACTSGFSAAAATCSKHGVVIGLAARGASLVGMILSNATMLTCFTKAMHISSSLTATVAVTSFNFTCTAIISMLLLGEELTSMWWLGFGFILLGLAALTYGQYTAMQQKAISDAKAKGKWE